VFCATTARRHLQGTLDQGEGQYGGSQGGYTRKRYKGLDRPPKYVSPTVTYQLGHDYSFKTEQRVSILTLEGRVIVPYTGYARHVLLIQHSVHIGAAKLWYDKPRKQFYLLVGMEVEVAGPTPERHHCIVGVDVGQRYLAVVTDAENQMRFFPGTAVRAKADHYTRLRRRLQHKGTRSATRRLVVIAGRQRRLKQERNHYISRRIVDAYPHAYPHALIGLEDLTHIRERTHTRRKHGRKASQKQRRANRHASLWVFAELQQYRRPFQAAWPNFDKRGHIGYHTVMKLSEYARRVGGNYKTAWRWWRAGNRDACQAASGTVIVREPAETATRSPANHPAAIDARVVAAENRPNLESQAERLIASAAPSS